MSGRTLLGNQTNQNIAFHRVCSRHSKQAHKSKSDDKEKVTYVGVHHHGEEDRRGQPFPVWPVWPRREAEVGLNTRGGQLRQLGETHEGN